jgi:hypothetical protein
VVQINQEGVIIDMFVKRFKRKCDVRGCKNTANVFLVSKRREMGNTIAICTDCLKEAQTSIDGYVEEKKAVVKEVKPLFPHPELDVTLSSVADVEPNPTEVIEEVTEGVPISVAEDTVTILKEEETPIETPIPKPVSKPKSTNKGKKKTNKR